MNPEERIERCLRAAPRSMTPDGLLERLQGDVVLSNAHGSRSILQRWFAPAGASLSLGRVAAAALLAAVVLLPLTYAGSKIVRSYFTEGPQVEVTQNADGSVTKTGSMSVSVSDPGGGAALSAEAREEIMALRQAGEFERTLVREWTEKGMTFRLYEVTYTLSSGEAVTTNEVEAGTSPDAAAP